MTNDAELVVTLSGGRRVDAHLGEYVIHTDQPQANGGEGSAPSPFQLFLASLGTCAGIFVQGFCAKRGIPYEDIHLLERPTFDEEGTLRAVEFELQLPPGFPERYRGALAKVVEQCSVKRAIQAQPDFRVRLSPSEERAPESLR
jgi:ribosomal protein S12 methylthiotransferase accessory factor